MKNISALFISLVLVFFLTDCDATQAGKSEQTGEEENSVTAVSKKDKKQNKGKKEKEPVSPEVTILKTWNMPPLLKEISGIAYLDKDRFACVQDEDGIIYIYNTKTSKLEQEVSFGGTGDYEGVAVAGNSAYVIRSDGKLFGVSNINDKNPKINEYTTGLTAKNDVEGLTYDQRNNRLLLAIKGSETGDKDYKGIYAFDLSTKKLLPEPVYRLNLTDPVFANSSGKNLNSVVHPSEVAVNPVNGDIYIIDTHPQLLILNAQGAIQTRYVLSNKEFEQPEGMAFKPNGELYISNESRKETGNILQVKVDRK